MVQLFHLVLGFFLSIIAGVITAVLMKRLFAFAIKATLVILAIEFVVFSVLYVLGYVHVNWGRLASYITGAKPPKTGNITENASSNVTQTTVANSTQSANATSNGIPLITSLSMLPFVGGFALGFVFGLIRF